MDNLAAAFGEDDVIRPQQLLAKVFFLFKFKLQKNNSKNIHKVLNNISKSTDKEAVNFVRKKECLRSMLRRYIF